MFSISDLYKQQQQEALRHQKIAYLTCRSKEKGELVKVEYKIHLHNMIKMYVSWAMRSP